jgi:hypothetical protein
VSIQIKEMSLRSRDIVHGYLKTVQDGCNWAQIEFDDLIITIMQLLVSTTLNRYSISILHRFLQPIFNFRSPNHSQRLVVYCAHTHISSCRNVWDLNKFSYLKTNLPEFLHLPCGPFDKGHARTRPHLI